MPEPVRNSAAAGTYSMDWTQWFHLHGGALLLYARQWTRSRTDAEEAVQDGFIRFWRSRSREDRMKPPEKDLPLLFVAVKHAAFDRARRCRRRQDREHAAGREWYDKGDLFQTEITESERTQRIEKALMTLPGNQREVVVLKFWGRLTFRQIGRALRISPNTAASRYRYALAALQRQLRGGKANE